MRQPQLPRNITHGYGYAQGSVVSDVQGKLDHRKNHFRDLLNPITDGEEVTPLLPPTAERPPRNKSPPPASEILIAIKRLKNNKSP